MNDENHNTSFYVFNPSTTLEKQYFLNIIPDGLTAQY